MNKHEKYMLECVKLAQQECGYAAPNPKVGCVIVLNDTVIGTGYHKQYGQAHAEVNAINSVSDANLLKEATIYVNLEPCSHFGKTPPCSDLIIEKGLRKVVIGTQDSFSKVNGAGIKKLQDAGIETLVGVAQEACLNLNQHFFYFHENNSPYILLKWAETLDGFIGKEEQEIETIEWITQEESLKHVHNSRRQYQAILVGVNTVIKDNPSLTVRKVKGKNPVRLIVDPNSKITSNHFHVFNEDSKTVYFSYKDNSVIPDQVEQVRLTKREDRIIQIKRFCYNHNILSIMVEGGSYTINQFLKSNSWNEIHQYIGDKHFYSGINAPKINLKPGQEKQIGRDTLKLYLSQ